MKKLYNNAEIFKVIGLKLSCRADLPIRCLGVLNKCQFKLINDALEQRDHKLGN